MKKSDRESTEKTHNRFKIRKKKRDSRLALPVAASPSLRAAAGLALILACGSRRAVADGMLSIEAGAGPAQLRSSKAFFGSTRENLLFGTGVSAGAFGRLTSIGSRIRLAFGFAHHYLTGADAPNGPTLGVQALFPTLRLSLPGVFISLGYTQHVWSKNPIGTGRDGWLRSPGVQAVLAEAGIEYGLTPEASLTATLSTLFVNGEAGSSPSPAAAATVGIRIYFFTKSQREGGASPDFYKDGWRYPFGLPKNP